MYVDHYDDKYDDDNNNHNDDDDHNVNHDNYVNLGSREKPRISEPR